MVVVGDKLVAVTDKGVAQAWTVETGEEVFRQRLGGQFSSSPILCNEHIYASNLSGITFVFKVGKDLELIAKNRLGNDCYASPAAVDGQLFMRVGVSASSGRQEQLVCLAEPESNPSVQSARNVTPDEFVNVVRARTPISSANPVLPTTRQ